MKLAPRIVIFAAAVLALLVGVLATGAMEDDHDHDEHSLVEADTLKLAAAVLAMTVVGVVSAFYLVKKTSPEEEEEKDV